MCSIGNVSISASKQTSSQGPPAHVSFSDRCLSSHGTHHTTRLAKHPTAALSRPNPPAAAFSSEHHAESLCSTYTRRRPLFSGAKVRLGEDLRLAAAVLLIRYRGDALRDAGDGDIVASGTSFSRSAISSSGEQ